ncbi:unnamed protein product [Choristocarpus tenellus]
MTKLMFQVAVPKAFTMRMEPASGHVLPPGSVAAVTQVIRVTSSLQSSTKPLMMKLKITYQQGGRTVTEVAQVAQFPPGF